MSVAFKAEPGLKRKLFLGILFSCWALVPGAAHSRAQEPQSGLTGLILDPSGEPSKGFRLVFRVEGGDTEFISPPSDKLGKYSLSLPAGASYVLIAAVAPDGARLQVAQLPAIPVEEGVRHLDVRFRYPKEPEKEKWLRDLPWWQIGGAAAAVVVFSTSVLGDDDVEPPASPFMPSP